ncbi:amidohydrolase [Phenylobacterium sp.]|jgi:hippurate hydrolase|uniref:amidohydrolase n=1 Tax=Phenylobacterium sp. TaxID=1871053 RepID=UPI002F417535
MLKFLTALTASLVLASAAEARDLVKEEAQIQAGLDKAYGHLDALYKDIHAHPELALQETRTAALLAEEMRALGFEVTEHVGKTGVVAIYKNGPGPMVMVRTELDALPMEEKTGLPYASHVVADYRGKPTPVDHSCGHDIHMAAWVGAAQQLVAMKSRWHGTLMFIAQPAEETTQGARAMLDDGLFRRFGKPDIGFAQHVGPEPYGTLSYRAGIYNTASDSLEITFKGRGAHGSMPNVSIDPVVEAARFVEAVQTVISREKDPNAFGVISIGSIQAGSAPNIIPDQALVRGTIRTRDEAVRQKLLEGIRRTADAVAMMSGAPEPDVRLIPGGKLLVNDAAVTAKAEKVFKAAFGDRARYEPAPGNPSEDYSEFIVAGVPSLFWSFGGLDPAVIAEAKSKGVPVPANHTPQFAPTPEPTIRFAVEAMTLAVLDAMKS